MSKYTYKCPTEYGYKKFKLTRKQHNEIFSRRKINIFTKCEYFYNEHLIKIHFFTNALGVILSLLFVPVTIVTHGLSSIKDISKEIKDLFNQKERGSYSYDSYNNKEGRNTYDKCMKIIKGE